MSPTLDMFARDNTNDGGGWDVRFHHFTGLSDHGYPRLYKNFEKEHIQPLADYGGGSGCGSVYIHEPGFPDEWNKAPFTCDWGKAGLFRHTVQPYGATFKESAAPEKFIKVTRPTDADVDGMSAVYQASWKGPATFGWAGPDQGYIVRVTPKGYKPKPLPDLEKMTNVELVKALESPSHIRTLAAQRTLLRRETDPQISTLLRSFVLDKSESLESRIAAISILNKGYPDRLPVALPSLGEHPEIQPYLLRALGDRDEAGLAKAAPLIQASLKNGSSKVVLEAMVAAARTKYLEAAPYISRYLANTDPVIRHTAYRALAKMSAITPTLRSHMDPPIGPQGWQTITARHDARSASSPGVALPQHAPPSLTGIITNSSASNGILRLH